MIDARKWLLDREKDWARLEQLLEESATGISRLPPEHIRELGLAYRSTINDLSRARSSAEYQHLVPYLNNVVQRVHAKVYEKPPTRFADILRFFRITFPACFRRNFAVIFLSFLTFAVGSTLAMITVAADPATASYFLPPPIIEDVANGRLWMDDMDAAPSKSSFLMTNNIRVAFNAYVGGIFFGVGSLLILFYNGLFAFGGPLQVCINHGMGEKLLLFMIPHGVIELTTVFISGGAGMMIGLALLFPGDRPRWDRVREKSRDSLVLLAGCVVLLVVAGMIEGMVSLNKSVPDAARIGVALTSAILLFGYLAFSGRGEAAAGRIS